MNGIVDPYENNTHVRVRGRVVVVVEHAPNADSWHYRGIPADLTGPVVTFSHDEATPVHKSSPAVRSVLESAGLDTDVFDRELSESPLEELLRAVAAVLHAGPHRIPDLRGAYIRYQEG